MLDHNDKKYIKDLIQQSLNYVPTNRTSKGFAAYQEKKFRENLEKITELFKLYENGKETLSELLELKKLIKEQKRIEKTPRWIQESRYTISQGFEGVKQSRVAKDSLKALAYTNPITALMYQNLDLLKGLGGIAKGGTEFLGNSIYQLFKGKRALSSKKDNTLIPYGKQEKLTVSSSTNYIAAKNVYLQGGTNYINVYLNKAFAKQGGFPQKAISGSSMPLIADKQSGEYQDNPIMLEQQPDGSYGVPSQNKSDSNNTATKMLLGIKSLSKSIDVGNKILAVMKSKQFLILGAILLGVAGITALVKRLNNGIEQRAEDNAEEREIIQNKVLSSPTLAFNKDTVSAMFEKSNLGKVTETIESLKTSDLPNSAQSEIPKNNPHYKPLKTIQFNTNTDKVKDNDLKQKIVLVPSPYDGYFVKNIYEKNGTFTITCVRTDSKTGTSTFYISNVVKPTLWRYGIRFKKGFPLGYAENGKFKIHTSDESGTFTDDYSQMLNSMTSKDYANHIESMSEKDYKNNLNAADDYYKKISKLTSSEHIVKLLESATNDESGKFNYQDGSSVKHPSNNYSVSNKDVENAKHIEIEQGTTNTQQTTQPEKISSTKTNVSMPASNSNLHVGLLNGLDVIAACDSNLSIGILT